MGEWCPESSVCKQTEATVERRARVLEEGSRGMECVVGGEAGSGVEKEGTGGVGDRGWRSAAGDDEEGVGRPLALVPVIYP